MEVLRRPTLGMIPAMRLANASMPPIPTRIALPAELDFPIVAPARLPEEKRRLHQAALERWAAGRGLAFADAWATREACIAALAEGWRAPGAG